MEKNLSLLEETFLLPEVTPEQYSPLTLAYIGDAIFDLIVRTVLVSRSNMQAHKLHKQAIGIVNAKTQSEMVAVLEEHFTEKEMQVYKRGRNAKSATSAKNASITDYRRATGLEAVFGYLYLKKDMERLTQLIHLGLGDRL